MADSNEKSGRALSIPSQGGGRFVFFFGLIFVMAGAAMLHFLFFKPVLHWYQAQSWAEVDCLVLASSVGSHSDDDGTTYSVDISYSYFYEGNSYTGMQYDFFGGSSSGYENKQRIVDQFPVGKTRKCHVNPSRPDESVLTLAFQWTYLIGLFGAVFLGLGLYLMSGKIGTPSKLKSWRDEAEKIKASNAYGEDGGVVLKPAINPWNKLLFALLFVIIWDGVSGFMAYEAWSESGFGLLDVFAIIFGGIGILALLWIPYQVMALFNPVPELVLRPAVIPMGTCAQLTWHFLGGTQRLENLSILLLGEEEATYRQGTNTRTARSTFFKQEIASANNPADMQTGRIEFMVPEKTMHSLNTGNNAIKWSIRLKGTISKWPDVDENFGIVVSPK